MKTDNDILEKDDMLEEYDFSKGIRGKHFEELQNGYTVTVFSPNKDTYEKKVVEKNNYIKIDKDVSKIFQTAEDVNNALRAVISAIPKTKKSFARS